MLWYTCCVESDGNRPTHKGLGHGKSDNGGDDDGGDPVLRALISASNAPGVLHRVLPRHGPQRGDETRGGYGVVRTRRTRAPASTDVRGSTQRRERGCTVNARQRITSDPRVAELLDETAVDNGYWIYLKPGFTADPLSAHDIHEDTLTACVRALRDVEPCTCAECHPGGWRNRKGTASATGCPHCKRGDCTPFQHIGGAS